MYFAHTSEDGRRQPIMDHLVGTAALAEKFAGAFGAGEFGRCCGMLHDAGKFSEAFQRRLLKDGPKVDHSTAGAQAALKASRTGIGLIAAYCVAGHHAGLPDGGGSADTPAEATLFARMQRAVPDFGPFYRDVDPRVLVPKSRPPIRMTGKRGFSASFFIRMLFSCLVDADFLDTEAFEHNRPVRGGIGESIPALCAKLERYVERFRNPSGDLNRRRCEILETCLRKSAGPRGLYTLTVPTGGGKTVSSLAFALRHAAERGMERVIYAIPYTSIIEQNAAVFREILGDKNVLEHYSSYEYDDRDEEMDPKRLATENWDAPVVVTTNVQFFESLFANRTSRCRKLHNIAKSVIIFDEAQMIPREYLLPCVRAIAELVLNYGCTAVLCSATQPALQGLFPPEVKSVEICENVSELYGLFRRTRFVRAGEMDDETLARKLGAQRQVLCIVNTRRHAQDLYSRLKGEGTFHLSTLMTPVHRSRVLDGIRERLKKGEACRVVSTSLVEAGVDVDFPTVYREETGLDSEIQAAGRCNREGRRPLVDSRVVIFRAEEKYRRHLPAAVRLPADITAAVESKFDDIASPEAIRCYFETLYRVSDEQLDRKNIVGRLERGAADNFSFPFASVAEDFHFIENETMPILIPKEPEAAEYARRLRAGERSRELFRAAGLYCVNVYSPHFQALYDAGKVELLDSGIAVLTDLEAYSEETGLSLPGNGGNAVFA